MLRINEYEAIIEEFWDPVLSELKEYRIESTSGRDFSVMQYWCWIQGSWKESDSERIGSLARKLNVVIEGYSSLIVCASVPDYMNLLVFVCDENNREVEVINAVGDNKISEYSGRLCNIRRISGLRFELHSQVSQRGSFRLLWVGLSKMSEQTLDKQSSFEENYHKYFSKFFVDSGGQVKLKPEREFLIREEDLADLRNKIQREPFRTIYKNLRNQAYEYLNYETSQLMRDYVVLGGRSPNYNRVRDWPDVDIRDASIILSFVGLIENDQKLSRKACEFAFTLANCEYWRETFMATYPFSTWVCAAFTEALCVETVAIVIDWSGSVLNANGKRFLVESIYEKGMPQIERQFLKSNYYWDINPATYFFPSLILGSILIYDHWPLYQTHLRRFYEMFMKVFENGILKDGGTMMSPGYWNKVAVPPIYLYIICKNFVERFTKKRYKRLLAKAGRYSTKISRATDVVLGNLLTLFLRKHYEKRFFPGYSNILDKLSTYKNYTEGLLTTTRHSPEILPIGDASTVTTFPEGIFLLSSLRGLSDLKYWQTLADAYLKGNLSQMAKSPMCSINALLMPASSLQGKKLSSHPKVVILEDSCFFTSIRSDSDVISLFNFSGMPRKSFHNHRHQDAGAFILEFNKKDYFVDRGSPSYNNPISSLTHKAGYHNTLTALDDHGNYLEQNIEVAEDVKINVSDAGNKNFRCTLDLSPIWSEFFTRYQREIKSKDIYHYLISDTVESKNDNPVTFHLHTPYKCVVNHRTVSIKAPKVEICVTPNDKYEKIECRPDLYDYEGRAINHITFTSKAGRNHHLAVEIELFNIGAI